MTGIFEELTDYIQEILLGIIEGNLTMMFTDVNEKVGTISVEAGKTPQGWNNRIFNMKEIYLSLYETNQRALHRYEKFDFHFK